MDLRFGKIFLFFCPEARQPKRNCGPNCG